MGVMYYYENAHLVRNRHEHTCALAIYNEINLVNKAMHSKAKHTTNLNPDLIILSTGDLILLSNHPKP